MPRGELLQLADEYFYFAFSKISEKNRENLRKFAIK